eukprot:CAMPEP_0197450904 /NCGR_PEP_ID=MMETSP1175-20131217/27006_1 /TAXON_ID=1003142 /ORGANISM="Triceratium dubium, Strain CCMP147" /LENGTH=293 /DNA_ID=CAMNT_0042983453 /DNA_START=22 /DNA_END=900 /DNA_ORIENTATION=+
MSSFATIPRKPRQSQNIPTAQGYVLLQVSPPGKQTMAHLLSFAALALYWLPFVGSANATAIAHVDNVFQKGALGNFSLATQRIKNGTVSASRRRIVTRKPVSFYAMGDAPYTSSERSRFPDQVKNIPNDAEFMIHLGDMKGVDECQSDGPYRLVSDAFLKHSNMPVFLVPGDNDYYDCADWKMGWSRWSSFFLFFHQRFSKGWVSKVVHQPGREENFSFKRRGVLFIGVHTVGYHKELKSAKKMDQLLRDDLEWTRQRITTLPHRVVVVFSHAAPTKDHAIFFDGLNELAEES